MGLFSKLFSRNHPAADDKPVNPAPAPELSPHERLEAAIVKNPLAASFRAEYTDTAHFDIFDSAEFFLADPRSYVCFDLETTGLDSVNDQIIEIGAVRVCNGIIKEKYHQLVNPDCNIPASASSVNHITDEMVSGAPMIYEILPDFLSFVGSDILVAHNARFDSKFIAQACLRFQFKYPKRYFDSCNLSVVWPDLPDRKLSTFLAAAEIENQNAHRALDDAEALAQLMIVSMEKEFNMPLPDGFDFGYSSEHFAGEVAPVDDKLAKKRFVLTGKIDSFERADFEKLIIEHGGKCTRKISNATDYLVKGSFPGLPRNYVSKAVLYARKLAQDGGKIQIVSPDDVLKMLEES